MSVFLESPFFLSPSVSVQKFLASIFLNFASTGSCFFICVEWKYIVFTTYARMEIYLCYEYMPTQ